eukprot:comp21426_c0_seq1/m.46380 comp21426_c0_seq1/g.46380  ORF comp21426_c0_seq1/g.46380 comp21426_c0_seq1/m.46380 type:complete len:320 (+) comp21426_c0_seq1:322-1281(+)
MTVARANKQPGGTKRAAGIENTLALFEESEHWSNTGAAGEHQHGHLGIAGKMEVRGPDHRGDHIVGLEIAHKVGAQPAHQSATGCDPVHAAEHDCNRVGMNQRRRGNRVLPRSKPRRHVVQIAHRDRARFERHIAQILPHGRAVLLRLNQALRRRTLLKTGLGLCGARALSKKSKESLGRRTSEINNLGQHFPLLVARNEPRQPERVDHAPHNHLGLRRMHRNVVASPVLEPRLVRGSGRAARELKVEMEARPRRHRCGHAQARGARKQCAVGNRLDSSQQRCRCRCWWCCCCRCRCRGRSSRSRTCLGGGGGGGVLRL